MNISDQPFIDEIVKILWKIRINKYIECIIGSYGAKTNSNGF